MTNQRFTLLVYMLSVDGNRSFKVRMADEYIGRRNSSYNINRTLFFLYRHFSTTAGLGYWSVVQTQCRIFIFYIYIYRENDCLQYAWIFR